jgi:hypothetical protein
MSSQERRWMRLPRSSQRRRRSPTHALSNCTPGSSCCSDVLNKRNIRLHGTHLHSDQLHIAVPLAGFSSVYEWGFCSSLFAWWFTGHDIGWKIGTIWHLIKINVLLFLPA